MGLLIIAPLLLAACGGSATTSNTGATAASGTTKSAATTGGAAAGSTSADKPAGATAGSTGAAAGGAPVAAGGEDCEKVSSDLKLGMDMSLTGGTADLGDGSVRGLKLAVKEFNAKGGYKGKKVQCVILDDSTKPESGLANTTRLLQQDKVFGILAYANSGVAVPGAKQMQAAKVPLIVPVATATNITSQFTEPGSFVFHMSMADVNQVEVMLTLMAKQNAKKPAILHDVTGYGQLGDEDLKKAFKAKGITVVEDQSFDQNDTDMTGQLTKAKNAGADIIFTYALAPALANLLKSADRLNWYPPMVGSWTWAQPDMVKFAGVDLVKKFPIFTVQSFTIDRDETAKAFHEKVVKEYGADPVPITAAQTYDAANLILQALEKVGPDPKALRDAIENTDNFKAVTTAPAKPYSATNHEAIQVKDMFLAKLQVDGDKVTVIKAP
ncbi:MAG: hypothetical protein NVSMB42_20130 [Herpetosiphon sp.]